MNRVVRTHYPSCFYLRLNNSIHSFLVYCWKHYQHNVLSMGIICQKASCSYFRKKSSMNYIDWSWNCLLSLTGMNIFEVFSFQDYHFRHQVEFWSCWQVEIRSLTKREKLLFLFHERHWLFIRKNSLILYSGSLTFDRNTNRSCRASFGFDC